MSTILYARVSTADQTLDHQRTQAEAAEFKIDTVVADHGVSGVNTRLADRPQGKRLFDILRRGDVLVVRWVDRLGRNYRDVTEVTRQFMDRGVIVRTVINNMTFDGATADPMQMAVRDALIAFMAATAQAQAEATKEAQRAGIDARKGDTERYRGKKPSYDRENFGAVVNMLAMGEGASAISKATGLTRQTVLRIRDDRTGAEAALARWGL
ncbi:DNA invertase Pin-like site-specific DNA recombinase [Pseudochelatococcus lubricantis]|uniref:DNA invertase Pin-like site-specific DNA recombinase n=1 Tax=Pseudochelatococcus lubricantis TaxID=1538102 RepID=A0ABX0V2Z0_9HYPH|nr:recombinase family protein [Pseudochelatococcus lubricantis]NIJ58464.1 DNA invertase Pin-like site-specific DNA recombinase [Pseudochelatococcus lubricantis]